MNLPSLRPLLLATLLAATPLAAYDLPSVNLGFTSFLDGAPPAGPGFYFQQYLQYQHYSDLLDQDGDSLVPNAPTIEAWVAISQVVYQSNQELLAGGKWGLNFMLPLVNLDVDDNPYGLRARSGLGDLLVGPFLQWDPVMGENGPVFLQRVEFQVLCPTGRYNPTYALNASSNHFSFDPYWAATWFFAPGWEASWRLHYLWNWENEDTNTTPGQAVHANFAVSREILEKRLRLGLNGYFLKQTTATESNGVDLPGRDRVISVGPGAIYSFSPDNHLFANFYYDLDVRNRPEGWTLNFRWVHHF